MAVLDAERLTNQVTTLALCWRVVRADGVALGFTSHDEPLVVGGLRHASAPGMSPSAVVQGDTTEVDTLDVAGALSAAAITAGDLLAGRYDGAAVALFLVDWTAPDAGQHLLARGRLGAVETGDGPDAGFVATLLGPTAVLQKTLVERYSPECRATLGDARCRVDMRGRRHMGQVVGLEVAGLTVPLADLVEGHLRVIDGGAAGLERRIVAIENDTLLLAEPLMLAGGTRVCFWEGCDRRFATCADRFGNAGLFRGEPHVPGNDLLMQVAGL
jgi:uncharacterized phage protein (TIGR02218 family)